VLGLRLLFYASRKFDKNLDRGLSELELVKGRMTRLLLEEHFYW
jgi:hypothetical protein